MAPSIEILYLKIFAYKKIEVSHKEFMKFVMHNYNANPNTYNLSNAILDAIVFMIIN